MIAFKEKKPVQAVEAFTRALKLKPAYPEALNDLAEVYRIQGKVTEAEQALKRAIEIDPSHADSSFDLAKLYEQRRDFVAATQTYQTLLATHPRHRDALYNLALLYEARGDSRAARETVNRLLKLDPKYADAWYLAGRMAEKVAGDETELVLVELRPRCSRIAPQSLIEFRVTVVERVEQGIHARELVPKCPIV